MTLAVNEKQRNISLTTLQRIVKNDKTKAVECFDSYNKLICTMALRLTNSAEDAENLVREIFLDIWRYAAQFDSTDFDEFIFITIITRRRLMKRSE